MKEITVMKNVACLDSSTQESARHESPTRIHRWASVDYSSSLYDSETHPACKAVCRSLSALSKAPTPVTSATPNSTVNLTAVAHAPRPATADISAADSHRQPSGQQDSPDQQQQQPLPAQQQQVAAPAQQQKASKLDKLWATHKPKWFSSSAKQQTASPAAARRTDSEAAIDTVAGPDSR